MSKSSRRAEAARKQAAPAAEDFVHSAADRVGPLVHTAADRVGPLAQSAAAVVADTQTGYRETEHIRDYYATTRI